MKLEKPKLTGKTDKENLHIMETWAGNLVDTLNYEMSHIDNSNMTQGSLVTKKELIEEMQKKDNELRQFVVNRTKGG